MQKVLFGEMDYQINHSNIERSLVKRKEKNEIPPKEVNFLIPMAYSKSL